MSAGRRVDELCGDPDLGTRFAHASLDNVVHAEVFADFDNVDVLTFEGERGIAGDDEELRQLRQAGDDVLRNAVGEILLFRVAAHVHEGKHGDRRTLKGGSISGGMPRRDLGACPPDLDPIDPHRPRDILEFLFAEIDKRLLHPVTNLTEGIVRETNSARLRDALDPRGYVDAVAHQVAVALLDYVAEMDANTKFDALVGCDLSVALDHRPLDFNGAVHCVDDTPKLDNCAVARALDDSTVVHGDGWIDQVASERPQPRQNPVLVGSSKSCIADDIGHQDRGQFPGLARGASRFRPSRQNL